jgi:hypothetical protein
MSLAGWRLAQDWSSRRRSATRSAAVQCRDPFARGEAEVEADDLRPLGEEHGEHVVVLDEAAIDLGQRRGRGRAEALEFRPQKLQPACFACGVGARGRMAEHVHVERTARARAKRGDHEPCARRVRGADADRPERARVGNGSRHLRRRNAGHGCLDDRRLDLQKLEQRGRRRHWRKSPKPALRP